MDVTGWAAASAPGKIILFGEHAVVYGEPSLSLAIDRRVRVRAAPDAAATTVNGERLDRHRHAYLDTALRLHWGDGPLKMRTESEVPSASGLGSSAALSVATTGLLLRLGHRPSRPANVAQAAFEVEYETQGAASPNDTTASTAGGAVLLSPEREAAMEPLWQLSRGERSWFAHRVPPPSLSFVIANTGSRARTSEMVAKVRRFVDSDPRGKKILQEIGRVTRDGVDALRSGDAARLGGLMDRNHELLHVLGVDSPVLQKFVEAARKVPGTWGAKLTGAGGGGSLIVLTEKPAGVQRALAGLGADAFPVVPSLRGLEMQP